MTSEKKEISFSDSARLVVEQYCRDRDSDTDKRKLKQAAREINFLRKQISDPDNDAEFMSELRAFITEFVSANHKPGRADKVVDEATSLFCTFHEAMLKGDEEFEGTRDFGGYGKRAMDILHHPGLR